MTAQPKLDDATRGALLAARDAGDRAAMKQIMKKAGLLERSPYYWLTVSVAEGKFIDPFVRETEWIETGAVVETIPYRCNRAAIFNSVTVHKTDDFRFETGYEQRRTNITYLFGRP